MFFLVSHLRNHAPNPFLGNARGVEAGGVTSAAAGGISGATTASAEAAGDLLPNNAAELPDNEDAFFLVVRVNTFLTPAAAAGDGDGSLAPFFALSSAIAFALAFAFFASLHETNLSLPFTSKRLVPLPIYLVPVVRAYKTGAPFLSFSSSCDPVRLGMTLIGRIRSACTLAAAFASTSAGVFIFLLDPTNLSLPFTSKRLVPLLTYLAPVVRAYKTGAPFLSFSSSAELVRECLLLLGFLRPNFLATSSASSFFRLFVCFDDLDGSVPNDDQEGGDDSGESSGDLLLRLPVDLDITDNSSLFLNLAKPLRLVSLPVDIEDKELDECLRLGGVAEGAL